MGGWIFDILIGWVFGSVLGGLTIGVVSGFGELSNEAAVTVSTVGVVLGPVIGVWWMRDRRARGR